MNNEFLQTEEAIVAMLKTVYDPEIPVNVYDLGLIYKVDVDDEKNVRIVIPTTYPLLCYIMLQLSFTLISTFVHILLTLYSHIILVTHIPTQP